MLWWKDEINPWEYKNYNIENKFYTEYCFQIDFYRLKSERGGGNSSRTGKGHLLGHIPLLHTDT